MARPSDPNHSPRSKAEGLEQVTREHVREQMAEIASGLGLTLDEALRRLDRGDYDDRIVSSKLRMLRFLDEEPEYQQAAE